MVRGRNPKGPNRNSPRRRRKQKKSNLNLSAPRGLGRQKEQPDLFLSSVGGDVVEKMRELVSGDSRPVPEIGVPLATSAASEETERMVNFKAAKIGAAVRLALSIAADRNEQRLVNQAFKQPGNLMRYCTERAERRDGALERSALNSVDYHATIEIDTVREVLQVLFDALDDVVSEDIDKYQSSSNARDEMMEYFAMYVEDGPTDLFFGKRHPELEQWVDSVAKEMIKTCFQDPQFPKQKLEVLLGALGSSFLLIRRICNTFIPEADMKGTWFHPLYIGAEDIHCCIIVRILEIIITELDNPDDFLEEIHAVRTKFRDLENKQSKIRTNKDSDLLLAVRDLPRMSWAFRKFLQMEMNKRELQSYTQMLQERYAQGGEEQSDADTFDTRGFVGLIDIDTANGDHTGYIYDGGKRSQTVLHGKNAAWYPYCYTAAVLCPPSVSLKIGSSCFAQLVDDRVLLQDAGHAGTPSDIESREETTQALTSASDHFRGRVGAYAKRFPELFQMTHSWGPFFFVARDEVEYCVFPAASEDRLVEILDSIGIDEWEAPEVTQELFHQLQMQVPDQETAWYSVRLSPPDPVQVEADDPQVVVEEKPRTIQKESRVKSFRKRLRERLQQQPTLTEFADWLDGVEGVTEAWLDPTYGQGSHGSIFVRRPPPAGKKKDWIERKNTWSSIKEPTARLSWALVMEFIRDLKIDQEAFFEAALRKR